MCRIQDRSQYISFDGSYHAVRGACTYVLAKTCHSTMDLPFFKISGKNGKQQDQPHTFYLRTVYVHVFNSLVTLKKDHALVSRVVVGGGHGLGTGLWYFLPLTGPAFLSRSMAHGSPCPRSPRSRGSKSFPGTATWCSPSALGWKSSLMAMVS